MKRASGRYELAVAATFLFITILAGPAGATTLQPLTGVQSVSSSFLGSCARLTSGKVDCWGYGDDGQLGDGKFYSIGKPGSAVRVAVKGAGGTTTLGGVASLATDGDGYCARLISGKADCWGSGYFGQLGDGTFYTTGGQGSAIPVAVKGVGGSGTLGGVASLTSDGDGYCARLTSGKVDCWGNGHYGQLGNGAFYANGHQGSAVPVAVKGVGGSGTLGGVASLTSDGDDGGDFCARITSGKVDCWGYGLFGQLGDGTFYTTGHQGSAVPVAVKGVGGTGTLRDVTSLTSNMDGDIGTDATYGYCARLFSGKVDCWGDDYFGQLGDGVFDTSSAIPVPVKGVGGSGTLENVTSVTSDDDDGGGFCARLNSGRVDCWGYGYYGQLGDGTFYTTGHQGSAVPVAVKGVGGTGILGGVATLSSDGDGGGDGGFCARLTSGKVDCWGYGSDGELGNAVFYTRGHQGSAFPVAVKGIGGSGTLGGVATLTSDGEGFCAFLTPGRVDCWGYGNEGELGNGAFYTTGNTGSAVPVEVIA